MDACLDTLPTKLYQVNIHVGRIAWWQVVIGGFVDSPPRTSKASDAEDDDDDDAIVSKEDGDGDASSSGADEISTWHSYPLSLMTKKGK